MAIFLYPKTDDHYFRGMTDTFLKHSFRVLVLLILTIPIKAQWLIEAGERSSVVLGKPLGRDL